MSKPPENLDQRVLLLAPTGRDADLAARFLRDAELVVEVCADLEELARKLSDGAGLIFLTGEAVTEDSIKCLKRTFAAQPTWSDIPIMILTSGGSQSPTNTETLATLAEIGNVTLIERPVRVLTLLSALKAALRARNRQYQVRDLLTSEHEARETAEQANRLKDEFLATVSHELRNPLNVILGYSELLLRTPAVINSPQLHEMSEALKRNALSQAQLIGDLLDLSRLQMGKIALNRQTVGLAAMIENAVESVQAQAAEKELTIAVDTAQDLTVEGDPLRLQQVVWNLLNNAVKFTPAGGRIGIALNRNGSEGILVVEDSGQGIEADFLPYVFDMFRQADASSVRRQMGLGIGLALVRQLVELHGGSAAAESEGQGRGAKFTIRLPLSQRAGAAAVSLPENHNGQLEHLRVLIVDDSEDTIEMLRHLLRVDGALVTSARGALEALQIAAEKDFDVILSDISMPGVDGFEFLRRLRGLPGKRAVPVLALTGFGRAEDVARADAAGFFSHLTKPLDLKSLLDILHGLSAEHRKVKTA